MSGIVPFIIFSILLIKTRETETKTETKTETGFKTILNDCLNFIGAHVRNFIINKIENIINPLWGRLAPTVAIKFASNIARNAI